jgi:hypothetical protein
MGRYFLPEEGTPGRDHVVILMYKLWQKLGANPRVLGTALRLNGQPYLVVGVQKPGIFDRQRAQLTVPLVFKPDQINREFHWLQVMGRLKPEVTIKQAQQNMDAVTALPRCTRKATRFGVRMSNRSRTIRCPKNALRCCGTF